MSDLDADGFVRPAELQIVGARLKRKNIYSLNKYEAVGRAKGILSSYISEEMKQSADEHKAALMLRLMTADAVAAKSPTDLSLDDILQRVGDGEANASRGEPASVTAPLDSRGEIQKILNQFVAARIVIHTDDDKYNLVHDYIAPYARAATEGAETNIERANRLAKRFLAEYNEDPETRIPSRHLRLIRKYASVELISGRKARELIVKSIRASRIPIITLIPLGVCIGLTLVIGLCMLLALSLSNPESVRPASQAQFCVTSVGTCPLASGVVLSPGESCLCPLANGSTANGVAR